MLLAHNWSGEFCLLHCTIDKNWLKQNPWERRNKLKQSLPPPPCFKGIKMSKLPPCFVFWLTAPGVNYSLGRLRISATLTQNQAFGCYRNTSFYIVWCCKGFRCFISFVSASFNHCALAQRASLHKSACTYAAKVGSGVWGNVSP